MAPAGIKKLIDIIVENTDLHLNYPIHFIDVANLKNPVVFEDMQVNKIQLSHRVPSYGYTFTERIRRNKLDTGKLEAHGIPKGCLSDLLQAGKAATLSNGKTIASKDFLLPKSAPRKVIIRGDNDTRSSYMTKQCVQN